MLEINWLQLKQAAQTRNLSIQWVIIGDNYYLKVIDGAFELTSIIPLDRSLSTDTQDFEDNFKALGNKPIITTLLPFASKMLPNGKKLFKREHGIQVNVVAGVNTIIFPISYAWVKIIGLEVMYGEKLDTIDLIVLDSTTGTYSSIPNYQLNQFGFSVNVAVDEYEEQNTYDADLYQGMQIKIIYNSQSDKTIGINFSLNEVK